MADALNPAHNVPDATIVERIRAGDVVTYDRIFRVYWEPLCQFAGFILRDEDTAREVVADLFAALWERRAKWTVTTSVEAYLFGATRNRAFELRRNTARRAELLDLNTEPETHHASLSGRSSGNSASLADDPDLRLTIERALRDLPPRYQTAIYLRWRRDLEYDKIAEILGTSAGAAKKLVNRAVALLKERILPG